MGGGGWTSGPGVQGWSVLDFPMSEIGIYRMLPMSPALSYMPFVPSRFLV